LDSPKRSKWRLLLILVMKLFIVKLELETTKWKIITLLLLILNVLVTKNALLTAHLFSIMKAISDVITPKTWESGANMMKLTSLNIRLVP
jgi:hypothetical protein